eukprot:gene16944-25999_t
MAFRRSSRLLATQWSTSVEFLPARLRLDHGPDQYGVERHFYPPTHEPMPGEAASRTRGLTPPTEHEVYNPIKEPFLVPPKWRKSYNFSTGHGRYLYSKDPLWVEARERHWDDLQLALQVHRKNYEHMRKKFRKQWQDAHRYNLDEYLSVMNRVELEQRVEREVSEERRTKELEADLARIDAINLLQEKRRKMFSERKWKIRVWEHERYTEELQYMKAHKLQDFITFENLDVKLDQELSRWTRFSTESLKLNMFGRIPYEEDNDCKPLLEVQYDFMEGGLSEDGREAFRRLGEVAESTSFGYANFSPSDTTARLAVLKRDTIP